jgi:hypothetical protein
MSKIRGALVLSLAFAHALLMAQPQTGSPARTIQVSGRVANGRGEALRQVNVTLRVEVTDQEVAKARTDRNGYFLFQNLARRRYDVRIETPGYWREIRTVGPAIGEPLDVGTMFFIPVNQQLIVHCRSLMRRFRRCW